MTIHKRCIDSHVNQNAPNKNYADEKRLAVKKNASSDARYAFIYFNNPAPKNSIILTANLRVYSHGTWTGGSSGITAKRVTDPWREQGITYNNRPAVDSTHSVTVTKTNPAAGTEWVFDLSQIFQDDIDGADYYGIRLEDDNTTRNFFSSSEANDHTVRPTLELEWTTGPTTPDGLNPGGGQVVSIAKPVVEFDRPISPGGSMQSLQVQINPTNDFSSPAFDSGTVSATEPELDLSTTAYGGISNGSTAYWRVRWTDSNGNTSAWSTPAAFGRINKGTLTLNSPSIGTPQVDDSTPSIDWTLSGETQASFRLRIYLVNASETEWYKTFIDARPYLLFEKEKATATTDWQVARKVITSVEDTYRLVLRVFDVEDRAHTQGDPPWYEQTLDFTYVHNATPTAPNTLTLTGLTPAPAVRIAWHRSTEPDSWIIRIGKHEKLKLDGPDPFVSGDLYQWDVWDIPPRESTRVSVEAYTDGTGSSTPVDDHITTTPQGLWVIDTDDNTHVFIAGGDAMDGEYGEDGQMYYPIGNQRPVRVTSTLRGLEGSISGVLLEVDDFENTDVETWRTRLLRLKQRSVKGASTIELIADAQVIPIRIGALSIIPTPVAGARIYQVKMEFFQNDDFPMAV